ncbi:hypothetical protein SAMN02744133_102483 [Thalassospira xiamenensis M-5 = DSM 17429]|nr:hypothetical protein SAMN02744133_102483 [Thalassospira xiamenensis M-5 = DSM 17429]
MIVKKLQIPAHVPGIVSKRLFDLSRPLYAYRVAVEKYRLCNAGPRYRTVIFLVSLRIVFLGFWGSYILGLFVPSDLKFSEDVEHKKYKKYGWNKGVKIPDVNASSKNRYCNKYPQGSLFVPCVRNANAEKKQSGDADDVKDEFKHRIHSLLLCFSKYCIVPLYVILSAPIRKVAARMCENIALLHHPARPTGFPFVPSEAFVLVGDGTIDVFPNLIDTMQIMSALDQVSFGVLRQSLQNFLTRAGNKRFVCFIGGHHEVPFSDCLSTVVTRPKRNRVIPVQIVGFLVINLRVCRSHNHQKESGNE